MKFFFSIALFVSMSVVSVYSAVSYQPPDKELLKDRPNECFESNYKIGFMKSGEEMKAPGECEKIVCQPNGYIMYMGCGKIGGCKKIETDDSQNWPHCCPRCAEIGSIEE